MCVFLSIKELLWLTVIGDNNSASNVSASNKIKVF